MTGEAIAKPRSEDLLSLRDLLEVKTGLYLPEDKVDRLALPFERRGTPLYGTTPGAVLRAITNGSAEGREFLNRLVASIATNETYFFRMPAQFDVLRNDLLPELLQTKRSRGEKSLKIWSAGCSTGEEPYSVAILLDAMIPEPRQWEISILATDLDLEALDSAREGIYGPWSFRGVEDRVIQKYFHLEKGERCRVTGRIRSMVTFQPLNLKSDLYPSSHNQTSELDMILCRNVTIYFRPETTQKIVSRFHRCLVEGGFLVAGPAEYSAETYRQFNLRVFPSAVIYQKAPSEKRLPSVSLKLLPFNGSSDRDLHEPCASGTRRDSRTSKNEEKQPLDQAVDLLHQEEVDRALMILAAEAERNPHDSRVCFLLGRATADRHHLQEADHWLSRTLTLDPLHLWAHFLLGLVRIEQGKFDEASQSLKRAIYIDPNFTLGHFYLGKLHKERGEDEKARKRFAVVQSILSCASTAVELAGMKGMTGEQLRELVEKELGYEK